jgi:hypothetical protein
MTSSTPKSSRFQIMRQMIQSRMDSRVGAESSKRTDKTRNIVSKGNNSNNKKKQQKHTDSYDGFTEGVFFKVPSNASLMSSDSSVTSSSSSSNIDNGSIRSLSYSASPTAGTLHPPTGWKSTERKSFLLHQPLMVSDPENIDAELESDPVAALGKVMAQSKKLPSTDYYCSNHIMVNDERVKRMIAPLSRLRELDDLARYHAESMAQSQQLFHSDPTAITHVFQRPFRRMGENVLSGTNIREIHTSMMDKQELCSDKYNILHRCYTHMGMGTAKGDDGQLYLCQIFRG